MTSKAMNSLDLHDSLIHESMEGVIGFRSSPIFYASTQSRGFTLRWRKELIRLYEPDTEIRELNVVGVQAYDAVWALADAIERAEMKPQKKKVQVKVLDLGRLRVSNSGAALSSEISRNVFHAAIARLPYDVSVEFITFVNGSYNNMVMQVYLQGYDGAVGDITITPTGLRNTHVQGVTKSNLNFADNRLKPYQSPFDYYDALSQGSKNGGVSAIVDEIPYIKLFLAKYTHIKYSIIESLMITNGFGFAFPKGSPLVHEISAAIVQLREEGKLSELEKKWFTSGSSEPMLSPDSAAGTPHATNTHSIDSFYGLFLVSGISKAIAVVGCDAIEYALKIFEQIHEPNIYLYTALIDGLVLSGSYDHGISMYLQMIESFVYPDNFVINSVLKACGLELDLRMERDVVAMTVMMSSYFEHELVERACGIFDLVKVKDTVCWTAMIDGLVRNGEMSKALEYFRQMQREGVRANELTVVCVLSACAQLGALELGKWVHSYMEKYDIEVNHFVGSALINMYSRCGSIEEAAEVFERMKEREVSTYNSMIVGFALNGKSTQALEMFQRMINDGKRPTNITFVGVLNACSHGGEQVAKILLNHDCSDTGSYVLVSNFYSSCGRWKEALLVRAKLKESGIQKEPGCSSIEVGNEIHEFLLGDIRHPQKKAIYRKLEGMDQKLRLEGYYPQVDVVSQDLKDQEKEKALAIHRLPLHSVIAESLFPYSTNIVEELNISFLHSRALSAFLSDWIDGLGIVSLDSQPN
ncbi:UNVERIFIED_CONTAM: putative pentatricopeptide repeat-containing protein, chloroplastic [Sesamum calycinum]|uniref:Pentatricopeptide repeat-containing protein, chloroplastic n=1 Tax=Sesamum calycinum TaxID=2727403 RepID=A0AAW2SF09_9LAMI